MNEPTGVSIFWDATAKPTPGLSGFDAVEAIRSAAKPLGFVKGFKVYADIAGFDCLSHDFRFQVQCSGVTLVDTASSGRLGSATKMILVDSFIHALDDPSSSILVLTNDPDICYGVSLLRLRGYHVFILSPSDAHPSLGQFSMDGPWDNSMLLSERRFPQVPQQPQTSGHGRRASLRVPVVEGSGNTGGLSEQDVLPTPTIQAFREQFAASSSLRTSSMAMARSSIPPRSMTVSPPSRSSSSADQVFRPPKATVETDDEDDGDYITLTPPKQKTPTSNGRSDYTPEPRSGSISSHSDSSGFSIVPLSQPTRDDTVAGLNGNEKRTSTSSTVPTSKSTQEPTSKASANMASSDGPNPSNRESVVIPVESGRSDPVAKSEEPQDLTLNIPPTAPEVKQPTPRRSTYPSFFPPPPLSPDRTPFVPVASVPASRPATAAPSLETLRAVLSNDSKAAPVVPKQPSGFNAFLAQGQQTPKPGSAPPSTSITKPFTPSKVAAPEAAPGPSSVPTATVPVGPTPSAAATPKPTPFSFKFSTAATSSASAVPPQIAVSAPPSTSITKLFTPSKVAAVEAAPGPSSAPIPTVLVGPRPTGATPKPAVPFSFSTAATPPASVVPPQFAVLVDHLKVLRAKGQNSVDRSTLGTALPKLQSDVYVKAQVSHFSKPLKRYCEAAEKAGVVVLKGANTLSLHPTYH